MRFMDPAAARQATALAPDFRAIHLAADSKVARLTELILQRWEQHGQLLAADIGTDWGSAADVLSAIPRFQSVALELSGGEVDELVEEILLASGRACRVRRPRNGDPVTGRATGRAGNAAREPVG